MNTAIYYFSATGNTLTTARMLRQLLPESELFPAAELMSLPRVEAPAGAVGLLFPVYYGDMPYPMRQLISRMVFRPDSYLFTLTTWRGHEGDAPLRVDQLLRTRGARLSLALGIPMPGNSFINPPELDREHLQLQRQRVEQLAPRILAREDSFKPRDQMLPLSPVGAPKNFRGLEAEGSCTGCGLCARLCPMGNIEIKGGRAIIGDSCCTCLSCFHWCPNEAIWMSREPSVARRSKYHHPEVTAGDIAACRGQGPAH